MLATELSATHRLAQLAEVEGRPQARRQDIRGLVGHMTIVGWPRAREEGACARDAPVPIASGAITRDDILGDLCDLVGRVAPGRLGRADITLFKNAGGGHLDLMTAEALMSRLEAR